MPAKIVFRFRQFLFKVVQNSTPVSWAMLVLAFVLDVIWGNEIFQRAGALVVGLALLHEVEIMRLRGNSDSLMGTARRMTPTAWNLEIYANFDYLKSSAQYPQVISTFAGAVQNVEDEDERKAAAERVLQHYFSMREGAERDTNDANKLVSKIVLLAFFGTLIWAFGDWVTNFVHHCPGMISCAD